MGSVPIVKASVVTIGGVGEGEEILINGEKFWREETKIYKLGENEQNKE